MHIVENLQKYLSSSHEHMSSYGKEYILKKDFTKINESIASGTFVEMGKWLKLKFFFIQFLQKKYGVEKFLKQFILDIIKTCVRNKIEWLILT